MKWKRLEAPGELPEDFKRKTRFLIDEGLGPFVAEFLRRKGWNALFCGDVGLLGHSDEAVFACAWREGRVLLTHDRDFLDDARFPEHRNPGLIVMAGASGDRYALGHSIGTVIWIFGHAPRVWERSKIVVSADGEIVIRSRTDGGKFETNRYRTRGRMIEHLEE
jgi:hypothetical protein